MDGEDPELSLLVSSEGDAEAVNLGVSADLERAGIDAWGEPQPLECGSHVLEAGDVRVEAGQELRLEGRQLGDLVHEERGQAHELGGIHRDEQLLGHGQGDGGDGPTGQGVHDRALEREHHLGACRPLVNREPELRQPIRFHRGAVRP